MPAAIRSGFIGEILREKISGMSPSIATTNAPQSLASDQTISPFLNPKGDGPIRAELYGLDRLETLARHLASIGQVDPKLQAGDLLLKRFAANGQALVRTFRRINSEVDRPEGRGIDADWLADNFHIVEEVLREIKKDLPSGYYAELPKLTVEPARGYPQVYALALALVAHTDSELDETRISRFVQAFQSASPLRIGEVWAVPTMLRLVLIENLRRLADRMVRGWDASKVVETWVAREFTGSPTSEEGETYGEVTTDTTLIKGVTPFPPLNDPTVVRLVQLLRDQGPAGAPTLKRLEADLTRDGREASRILRDEHRRQAANQVSVGNCVISLRLLSVIEWNLFFEKQSEVEVILQEDPSGVYARQDFATRDRYRRSVEKIARRSDIAEETVAHRAIELARDGQATSPRRGHVGYYLDDRGLPTLRSSFRYRATFRERIHDFVMTHPRLIYFGSILTLMAGLLTIAIAAEAATSPTSIGLGMLILVILALLIPASDIAVGLVNNLTTLLLAPKKLARLDLKAGIPGDLPSMVVVPSMLTRPDSAAQLLERLEITFLANPDPVLRFALLTDFADASEEHRPEDDSLVRSALDGVAALNARYAPNGPPRFYLFHRRRTWNPEQNRWMGWERKRGKLSEFNRLIRGDQSTHYNVVSSDPAALSDVKYVITLDADTILPRESARRLVGTIAHPLNMPVYDPAQKRVVEGYGVLQPRVSYHLYAATRSRFAGLLAASAGIDPYSNAVSDTYMDLFGLGTFTGKGVYDVDAFEAAVGHAFPDNAILSHDLIEGNYSRCGLVTDVELFDDFPPRYHAYAMREHRWARGDWQLLPWLGFKVPTPNGPRPNPLPLVERWKMFDNLRRSLVPASLVFLLVLGWTTLPGSPWLWTFFALAVSFLPVVQTILGGSYSSFRARSFTALLGVGHSLPATAGQSLLWIAFLADQARRLLDAIIRTLSRLFVSHKNLLEWETAAATEHRLGTGIGNFIRAMWFSPAFALALGGLIDLIHPSALLAASPVLIAWFVAPLVAYWISRPRRIKETPLTEPERAELRRIARKTWHFFETFVGDEDHWLPPDNYQEDTIGSGGRVAHRTSPTNKGMLLLSTLAAHDFGYLSLKTLTDRLHKTFDTFDRLEKHEGHLYNWYNTQTLRTLQPNYVSTVDSGNFLGCLVTLKQGMREKVNEVIPGPNAINGLVDTLAVLVEDVKRSRTEKADESSVQFSSVLLRVQKLLHSAPGNLSEWQELLDEMSHEMEHLTAATKALTGAQSAQGDRWLGYARCFENLVRERDVELGMVAPWLWSLPSAGHLPIATLRPANEQESALLALTIKPGTLIELAERAKRIISDGASIAAATRDEKLRSVCQDLSQAAHGSQAAALVAECDRLGERAARMAADMKFGFLYKEDRHLFAIGLNMATGRLDASCYDLLASEAALSSFLAVARGDAPRRHWFQLGRPFIEAAGRVGLMSWGGSCFEYLMPRLMMLPIKGTLLDTAHRTAVARQMEYGRQLGVPWGISESAFAAFSVEGDYHYQSFGTPGLGLKRDIGNDLVIAPYATALAVAVEPRAALENFRKLAEEGAEGRYGFHEAVDFTADRVPKGKRSVVVRSYMAHHHGMGLVAIANALLDEPMPRRFHAEPMIRAIDLLLQERVPRDAPIIEPSEAEAGGASATAEGGKAAERVSVPLMSRRLSTPTSPVPRTHLLSNGQYTVMLTNAGSGSSVCRGIDVTRWRADATLDDLGQFIYIRDVASHAVWSSAYQPTRRAPDHYEAIFSADKVAFRRLDGSIESLTEITVSPEARAEIRRVTLTNHDTRPRELEVTSYGEVVLLAHGADISHPAFGKLFLETEWAEASEAILCRRRPRSGEQSPVWAVHVAATEGAVTPANPVVATQYETDRAKFLGRGRTPNTPAALDPGATLSGTVGAVLDPIVSIRRRVRIEPGMSAAVAFTTAVADSRDEALTLADHYREIAAVSRAFELAWAHSQVEHRSRNWSAQDAHTYQRLASCLLYTGTALRADPAILARNQKGQPGLWTYGISGDKPIIVAFIADFDQTGLVAQLLTAHTYLRLKGLETDLVFLTGPAEGDLEDLPGLVLDLVRGSDARDLIDARGGIYIRKPGTIPEVDRVLLQSYARVVLHGDGGSLAGQLDRTERTHPLPDPFVARREPSHREVEAGPMATEPLLFDNGTGGFAANGAEYVIKIPAVRQPDILRNGRADQQNLARPALPPAPWVNVIANPNFGFLTSAYGGGYSWASNSQSNRLTPWANDPVSDPPGEVFYLRDEISGDVWCPTPGPIPAPEATLVRHGQGYTIFERTVDHLSQRLTLLVPPDDPVKVIHLEITNEGAKDRHLSATYFAEWVLGSNRAEAAMKVLTELDVDGPILARNPAHPDYSAAIAFLDASHDDRTFTADRTEFLGRNGSVASPAALGRVGLSGTTGAGLDPCGAIQVTFSIAPGATESVVFVLGQAETLDEVRRLASTHREPSRFAATLAEVKAEWRQILGAVQVETPDPAMNVVLNHWLLFQALSCRFWGRSATYQSGGAYGYRDQLQDSMALVYGIPTEARAQIVRAASRQFIEGDVQHWWHPPDGKGIRTKISDDLIWLPYVVAHYVETTGDHSVLDEVVPFLEAPPLRKGQEDDYGLPAISEQSASVYDHCVRALDRAYQLGPHGLPLMGTGDWNDGMNRVGAHGRGESVWNSWFLIATLNHFGALAQTRGDSDRASLCQTRAENLRAATEANAWDGRWYLRAFFDDGTPLGSSRNDECQIDSIPQSWATIAGVADPDRARQALEAVDELLVKAEDGVILLFTPPFDQGKLQPGYIRGYVPGIRENGGQYTHAATWLVLANALANRGGRAVELFNILNPVRHALDADAVGRYFVEPYVVAADVYGRPPHTGRGGWTWYTGSASWLYRVGLEAILGFQLHGDRLAINPKIASDWPGFTIDFRHKSSRYRIEVSNPDGAEFGLRSATLDGQAVDARSIPLVDDGAEHQVKIVLGR